jgi:hypothetical protein
MDQTGNLKKVDNGGKPLTGSKRSPPGDQRFGLLRQRLEEAEKTGVMADCQYSSDSQLRLPRSQSTGAAPGKLAGK